MLRLMRKELGALKNIAMSICEAWRGVAISPEEWAILTSLRVRIQLDTS
jgi:hypothetical protein